MEIEIITPPVADETEPLEHGLIALTQAISQIDPNAVAQGFLGGEFGYGADYENDIFIMHHYCWCEQVDCPWCAGCWCFDNCKSDGWGRALPPDQPRPYPEGVKCPWCSDEHRWADKGALSPREHPHYGAPHFWHKASGLRVWWYKWIGRDMIVVGSEGADMQAIFSECLASLRVSGRGGG